MATGNDTLLEAKSFRAPLVATIVEPRRAISFVERTWELETFYDLTVLLTNALAAEAVNRSLFPDSRAIMDTVLIWANYFNELFAYEDWVEREYLEAVESWFRLQIRIRSQAQSDLPELCRGQPV